MEQQQRARAQKQRRHVVSAAELVHDFACNDTKNEQLSCVNGHPRLHMRREPDENVKILMSEGETVACEPHGLADEILAEREIIEQIVFWDGSEPAYKFWIHPSVALHYG